MALSMTSKHWAYSDKGGDMIDWYTFNVGTLTIEAVLMVFILCAQFSVREEKKKVKRMMKQTKYGVRK
jgi:hypothetical protein